MLNRPTANIVQLHADGRRAATSCSAATRGCARAAASTSTAAADVAPPPAEPGGTAVGDSCVRRIGGSEAAAKIRDGDAKLDDFLLISGAMAAPRAEIRKQVSEADLEVVAPAAAPWPQIWGLAKVEADGDRSPASDGTALWWASTAAASAAVAIAAAAVAAAAAAATLQVQERCRRRRRARGRGLASGSKFFAAAAAARTFEQIAKPILLHLNKLTNLC